MNQFIIATDRLGKRNAILAEMQFRKTPVRPDAEIRRLMLDNILQALYELFEGDIHYNEVLFYQTTGIELYNALNLFSGLDKIFKSADTETEHLFDALLSDAHDICRRAKIEVGLEIKDPASQTARFKNIILRDLHNILDKIIYILDVNIDFIKKRMPF